MTIRLRYKTQLVTIEAVEIRITSATCRKKYDLDIQYSYTLLPITVIGSNVGSNVGRMKEDRYYTNAGEVSEVRILVCCHCKILYNHCTVHDLRLTAVFRVKN